LDTIFLHKSKTKDVKRIFMKKLLVSLFIATLSALTFGAEPSLHEVYTVIEKGQLDKAETLMAEVIKNHPDSAKAHYVLAELRLKEHRIESAREELATAEKLSPGLAFAKPEAITHLKNSLYTPNHQNQVSSPWWTSPILWGAIIALALFLLYKSYSNSRQPVQIITPANPNSGFGYTAGQQPYPPGYPPTSPGMGSGLMGSLATGAALGAGMVAGEALAHNLMGDHRTQQAINNPDANDSTNDYDFGVNDSSSWDDGGSSGGGDWN
jgi:tetratricopeptide (TPR) repeat protein